MNRRKTTETGYVNRNGQKVIRATGEQGTDHHQYVYVLHCRKCSNEYGANGSDIHERKCLKVPRRQEGDRVPALRSLDSADPGTGGAQAV